MKAILTLAMLLSVTPAMWAQNQAPQTHAGHETQQSTQAPQAQAGPKEPSQAHQCCCQMMMQQHQQMMQQNDQALQQKVEAMNAAKGDAKVQAMADVIKEMTRQHQQMLNSMVGQMGHMSSGQGMQGMKGMKGMQGMTGCPMMQQKQGSAASPAPQGSEPKP